MNLEFIIISLILFILWWISGWFVFLILGFVFLILSPGRRANIIGGKSWADGLSLMDPKFNLREVAKQMILLEDHLFHKYKHCLDCISKHTLFVEGLLEEALTMDVNNEFAYIRDILQQFRDILPPHIKKIQDGVASDKDYTDTANKLREIRKPLAKQYAYYNI